MELTESQTLEERWMNLKTQQQKPSTMKHTEEKESPDEESITELWASFQQPNLRVLRVPEEAGNKKNI